MGMFLKFFLKDLCSFPYDSGPVKGMLATYFISLFVMTIYEGVYLYFQNKHNILQQES